MAIAMPPDCAGGVLSWAHDVDATYFPGLAQNMASVDYRAVCEFAINLTKALHQMEVFELASSLLFSKLPNLSAISFTHVLNNKTETVTMAIQGTQRHSTEQMPLMHTAAGHAIALLMPIYALDCVSRLSEYTDWQQLHHQHAAVSVYTVPVATKARGVGAITVAASVRGALEGGGKALVDTVSSIIAPYMHIKDVRRELQVAQTLLLDSLPGPVVSHMLERQTMGMTPVIRPSGGVEYPRSDDSASDSEES